MHAVLRNDTLLGISEFPCKSPDPVADIWWGSIDAPAGYGDIWVCREDETFNFDKTRFNVCRSRDIL